MRYWLFQNNQVIGPYAQEELAKAAGFSAESLVCPEGRQGTQMGDWQRASAIIELAETLKAAQVPSGAAASAGPAATAATPEPTLGDIATLGALQEKVGLLETSLKELREDLRSRGDEISALKSELNQKGQETGSLQAKIASLETQISSNQTRAAETSSQTQMEQAHRIEALRSQMESLRSELSKLETGQSQLHQELRETALKIQPPKLPPASQTQPLSVKHPEVGAYAPEQTPPKIAPAIFESGPVLELPTVSPGPPATAPSSSPETPTPIQSVGAMPKGFSGSLQTPAPAEPPAQAGGVEFMDLTEEAGKKKKSKKGLWVAALALLAAAAGALYYFGALGGLLSQTKLAQPAAEPPETAPASTASKEPLPSAQQGLPDRTQEAIEFAKSYPIGGSGETLASALEGHNPPSGLSPWMVEKIEGEKYRVNFYPPGSKKPAYEFEARLDERTLRGLTDPSEAILEARATPPAGMTSDVAAKKRHRQKPPSRRAKRRKKAKDDISLDDLLVPDTSKSSP